MTEKQQKALQLREEGYNCAQAVIGAFAEDYGLSFSDAMRVSAGFGSGMRVGEICGAASGAVVVIGLKYGSAVASEKEPCNSETKQFLEKFTETAGTLLCRDLLAPNGYEICNPTVIASVGILEELGY